MEDQTMSADDEDATMKAPSSPSDEEMRKLLVPNPDSNEQLLTIVNENYNLPNARVVRKLDSYDDANYMIEDADGVTYLLKVHNGFESREYTSVANEIDFYAPGKMTSAIHLQNAIMELCYEHGLLTSRPIPVKASGKSSCKRPMPVCVASLPVLSVQHSPCDLVVRLLSWVPGSPMSNIEHLPLEALAEAGRYLGKMDRILDNINEPALKGAFEQVGSSAALLGQRSSSYLMLDKPDVKLSSQDQDLAAVALSRKRTKSLDRLRADLGMEERPGAILDESLLTPANRYHQWDTKNTSDLRDYVHHIEDPKRRGMIESVIQAFEDTLIKSGVAEQFRKGVNHGDFNDANILVDNSMKVCGAIDFGDSVMSWRVLDVAVAMAYSMMSCYGKKNRSLSAAAGLLRGYNAVYQLTDLERQHLMLLMACRLACSVTLGAYSYQQNPENKYLLFHAEPGWKTLELIWGYDAEHRQKLFDAAAGLFSQACLYSDPREKVVTCYDLVIPDPGVADLLASVRVLTIDISAESPKKKLKTSGREMIPTIAFVTKEAKHFNEVMRMLKPDVIDDAEKPQLEYRLEAVDIGLVAIEGDFIEIAKSQCIAAARKTGSAVVTEVTGLCFTALNGLPGPYTTPFLNSCGVERLQQMVAAFDDKTAYAKTVVCFSPGADSECDPVFFDGRTRGCVVSPRGENGCSFEFDTIFQPDKGNGKTYAEMSPEEKDSISHRGRAYRQLQNYFQKFRKEIASKL